MADGAEVILHGIRTQVLALVYREIKNESLEFTDENKLATLIKIKEGWENDPSDTGWMKQTYIVVMEQIIQTLKQKLGVEELYEARPRGAHRK